MTGHESPRNPASTELTESHEYTMKPSIILIASIAFPIALTSCSQDHSLVANDDYPLTTGVVSGEPLGSMGEPSVHDHKGTKVKFWCKNCLPKFNKDPDTDTAKLRRSIS